MSDVMDILDTMAYGPAPEDDTPVRDWLARHKGRFGHFIDGRWVKPSAGGYFETANPADMAHLAKIAQGTDKDIDRAVKAARRAFAGWSGLTGQARARYLYALARHVQKHSRFLAVLETLDNGKPIRETRDIDVPLVARHFYHHAGWAELAPTELADHRPVGVCGQIIPWNFPLLMLAWKVAPALAAGCTVVLKPAEFTPLTALAFAELSAEVGLPPGVLNIVTGDGETGATLVEHPDVDKLAFTGSTEVGRIIRTVSAGTGKKLSLELGGKSPFVVLDDADLDSAVEGVVDAIWFNQGQVCCAGSRLLVQEGVAEHFYGRLRDRMETLRVGSPLDKAVDMGAIVAPVQLERIRNLVSAGVEDGVRCWQPSQPVPRQGCFYPPTLIADVDPASSLAQEEIFGPVLVATSFRTPDEAVALANNTRYGLAASVWSESVSACLDIARRIKAGVVWINGTNMLDAAAGFGGYRESGFGREGGREGMHEYLVPAWQHSDAAAPADTAKAAVAPAPVGTVAPGSKEPPLDRTAKLYIGGKQARPDSGYVEPVFDTSGNIAGHVGHGNRKDLRNAVEAAHKAGAWSTTTGHARAQVLYYFAENLEARGDDFADRIALLTGATAEAAAAEVAASVARLVHYAAWADKYDGAVREPQGRVMTLALNEPWGVMGVICPDEAPLLAFISLVAPAVAMGNRVIAVPSQQAPLVATDLYQVLDTSDVPGGVVNIVTGPRDGLAKTLAEHDDVACVWYAGSADGSATVEKASAGNLKATWVNHGKPRNWSAAGESQGAEYLRRATQVKTVWIPFGV